MARKAKRVPNPPGQQPKHGSRLLARVLRENRLDRRTVVAKLLASVENNLAADRGGWPNMSAAESILVRRAAFLALVCSSIENWVLQQPGLIVKGELVGPLRKGLATHQANLGRMLAALGIKSSAPKVPSLDEYLAARGQNGNGNHNGHATGDNAAPSTSVPQPQAEDVTAPAAAPTECTDVGTNGATNA